MKSSDDYQKKMDGYGAGCEDAEKEIIEKESHWIVYFLVII